MLKHWPEEQDKTDKFSHLTVVTILLVPGIIFQIHKTDMRWRENMCTCTYTHTHTHNKIDRSASDFVISDFYNFALHML